MRTTIAALVDASALVVFVAAGVATHGASLEAFGRDAACFLGAWFAVALAVRLYPRGGRRRLAATWLVGVTAGVFVRAAIVGAWPGAFYGVALGFTALFVLLGRVGGQALSQDRVSLEKDIAGGRRVGHGRSDGESAS